MAGVAKTTEIKSKRRGVSSAPDPLVAARESYKVTFENDLIRVLDINLRKGKRSPMHSHPNYLGYAVTSCRVRFTYPDGKSEEVAFKAGDTVWREAEAHQVDNVGDTDCHVLNIELKQQSKAAH
jgi:quercetin dioxygenase-like cupin family protein